MGMSQLCILVVEDDMAIREALKMTLELDGFSVLVASGGVEALAILKNSPLPNLILLDLLMPGMNGYEFLEHIKKEPAELIANIPIIVLSAVAKIERNKIPAVHGVFQKPVDLNKLVDAIRSILLGVIS